MHRDIQSAGLTSQRTCPTLDGRIKGTVKVTTEATDAPPASLVGARLTLVNRDLTEQVFKVVTDDVGNFIFTDLPAATFVLTVEADGAASVGPRALPHTRRESCAGKTAAAH